MKNTFYLSILAIVIAPLLQVGCQNTTTEQKKDLAGVEVFPAVEKTAEWVKFKYRDHMAKASNGNAESIKAMLEFSGTVDGVEALDHAVTCIELIPLAGDPAFADVLMHGKPLMRKALLERFQIAQARTKDEKFRKPMAEWAPATWAVLNEKPIPTSQDNQKGPFGPPAPASPDSTGSKQ